MGYSQQFVSFHHPNPSKKNKKKTHKFGLFFCYGSQEPCDDKAALAPLRPWRWLGTMALAVAMMA